MVTGTKQSRVEGILGGSTLRVVVGSLLQTGKQVMRNAAGGTGLAEDGVGMREWRTEGRDERGTIRCER
jgi:hypothetical protein